MRACDCGFLDLSEDLTVPLIHQIGMVITN
jgi:hypothetical protein